MKTKQSGVSAELERNLVNDGAAKTPFGGVSAELERNLVNDGAAKTPIGGVSAELERNSVNDGAAKTPIGGVSAELERNLVNDGAAKTPIGEVSAGAERNSVNNGAAKKTDYPWHEFLEQCMKFNKVEDLAEFLNVFLTISERDEIPKRLQIVKELMKGEKTQREIAESLKVSIANVTRASNIIKSGQYNLTKLLK
ncbi:MAG: tRPR [Burkholderiales bacterium]|nr:tRPR [Burkholderiales bacterium]